MDWLSLIITVSCLVIPITTRDCPKLHGCDSCLRTVEETFLYQCSSPENKIFEVGYRPLQRQLSITCSFPATLFDVHVSADHPLKNQSNKDFVLSIKNCGLSKTVPLSGLLLRLKMMPTLKLRLPQSSTIEAAHFEKLQDLQVLELTADDSTQVHKDFLRNLGNLKSLGLHGWAFGKSSSRFWIHTPQLRSLKLYNNKIEYSLSEKFNNLPHLESLDIRRNNIPELEDGFFARLTALRSLKLMDNELREIHSRVFFNSTQLTTVLLFENGLTSLPDDLFRNNREISTLAVVKSTRRRTEISTKLFSNLTKLTRLRLSTVEIKDLDENSFLNLKNLEFLMISSSDIQSLPDGVFKSCRDLRTLSLSRNRLRAITSGTFENLRNLENLDLNNNGIKEIQAGAFGHLWSLDKLDLSYNELSSENDFSKVFEVFRFCRQVIELTLDRTETVRIHLDWTFSNETQLEMKRGPVNFSAIEICWDKPFSSECQWSPEKKASNDTLHVMLENNPFLTNFIDDNRYFDLKTRMYDLVLTYFQVAKRVCGESSKKQNKSR